MRGASSADCSTESPLAPHLRDFQWWPRSDLNREPTDYEATPEALKILGLNRKPSNLKPRTTLASRDTPVGLLW